MALLRKYSPRTRAVMHGFDGGPERAQELADLGQFVSFSENVTSRNAGELQNAARTVPIDRILVETGSPYFGTPCNKRNEPALVRSTAAFIANLRGMSLAAFGTQTTQNAQQLFGNFSGVPSGGSSHQP
jgi:TatD DNase family protein